MKDGAVIAVNPQLRLVLGGARSGKSAFAESLIAASSPPWIYLATAEALDEEMAARIDKHRARRDRRWQTIEAPHRLSEALAGAPEDTPILIDCLSLWLSNRLLAGSNLSVEIDALVAALAARKVLTVAVSSEVGMTVVPENALARAFRDAAGELHQAIASVAASVTLTVAGYPLKIKG